MSNGFDALTDGDLILCANLLLQDARSWEDMTDAPEHQALIRERAEDRRRLAQKLKAESDRRMVESLKQ